MAGFIKYCQSSQCYAVSMIFVDIKRDVEELFNKTDICHGKAMGNSNPALQLFWITVKCVGVRVFPPFRLRSKVSFHD